MFCGDGEYNTIGSLYLSTPEESIKKLFHDDICMCVYMRTCVHLCVVCMYMCVYVCFVCVCVCVCACVRVCVGV